MFPKICLLISVGLLSAAGCANEAAAPEASADLIAVTLTQGTNMSATVSPDGSTIVASIQGTLWSIPGAGGPATALTRPEMDAQEPVFSPDGKLVAFYAFANDGWSIWTIAPDGSRLARRSEADGLGDARYPSFSSDSTRLLYSTDSEGGYSAVALDLASGRRSVLVDAKEVGYTPPTVPYFQKAGNVIAPVLSPDGRSLAFVVDGQKDELRVRELATGASRSLYSADNLGSPAWALDGGGLYVVGVGAQTSELVFASAEGKDVTVVSSDGDIFPFRPSVTVKGVTVTADGGIKTFPASGGAPFNTAFSATVSFPKHAYARRIYDFSDVTPSEARAMFDPALSPDGAKAVFTAIGDLWITDIASGTTAKLTDDEAIDLSPSWSPDGKLIAFVSDREGKSDIWTITPDGKTFVRLTDLDAPANAPSWSPDGTKIAFLKDALASIFLGGTVQVLDVKTKALTQITAPIFGPSQPSWSPDGNVVAIVARKPITNRFREGINALLLTSIAGRHEQTWVEPVPDKSLGRRQWNRPAWSAKGDLIYRIDGQLWLTTLDGSGRLGSAVKIADSGENPNWSADGSKAVFVDGDKLRIYDAASKAVKETRAAATYARSIPESSYTIRVGRLFDGKAEGYHTNMDVVVEKNRITAVRPADSAPPVGALVDASDKMMMPGLIEGHTHQSTSLGRKLGLRWFSYGVTSVRETGTDPYEAVERREAEIAGRRPGPRVFTAGPLNEGGRVSYGISETVGTPELAVAAVERSNALKLDMLKSYVREDYTTQKMIIAEAHKTGIPVSGHELYPALANGADQMEHFGATSRRGYSTKISRLNRTYDDVIFLLARSGMIITPTLALQTGNGARIDPAVLTTLKKMYDSGVSIMAGVDSPFVTFADTLHTEMRLYSMAGVPNSVVLRIATSGNAKLLNADNQIGSIEPGKIADLVLIDGDPLADITDTLRVTWTMKNGVVVWEKK